MNKRELVIQSLNSTLDMMISLSHEFDKLCKNKRVTLDQNHISYESVKYDMIVNHPFNNIELYFKCTLLPSRGNYNITCILNAIEKNSDGNVINKLQLWSVPIEIVKFEK